MFRDELADAVVIVIVRDSIRGRFLVFSLPLAMTTAHPGIHRHVVIVVRVAEGAELIHRKTMAAP